MGFNWHNGCALICLLPASLIASDADIISAIESLESTTASIGSDVSAIVSDVSQLESDLIGITSAIVDVGDKIGYSNPSSNLQMDILDLKSYLQNVSSILTGSSVPAGGGSIGGIYVEDKPVYNEVHSLSQAFNHFSRVTTNFQSSVATLLDSINTSINNLTNYLCYSPDYTQSVLSAFPTNIIALLGGSYSGDHSDYVDDQFYKDLFRGIYGRLPTQLELNWVRNIYTKFGVNNIPITLLLSEIAELPEFPDMKNMYGTVYEDIWDRLYNAVPYNDVADYADLYYYEYGTRPLIDGFIAFTNQVGVSERDKMSLWREYTFNVTNAIHDIIDSFNNRTSVGDVTYITESSSGDNTTFNDTFVSTVGSLSSSFMPNVNTNVSDLATNSIVAKPNNSFENFGNTLRNYDNTDLESAVSLINNSSAIEDMAQYLDGHNGDGFKFVFNLHSLNSDLQEVEIDVSDTKQHTTPLIHYLCDVLKLAITIVFIARAWTDIIKPSPLFFP